MEKNIVAESLYQQRNALGLCPKCGGNRDGATKICSDCRIKFNANNKRSRAIKVANGECQVCPAMRTGHDLYCEHHIKVYEQYFRNSKQRLKEEVLEAYGGAICICCGESGLWFLTLDHVNNDGYLQRKDEGMSYTNYSLLKSKGYPKDPVLQVLCYNCNNGKRVNGGICPHQENRLWKDHAYSLVDDFGKILLAVRSN